MNDDDVAVFDRHRSLLFTLAYTPCLATVAEMRRQFGTKVAARSVLLSLAVAYVIAIIAFQTLRLIW